MKKFIAIIAIIYLLTIFLLSCSTKNPSYDISPPNIEDNPIEEVVPEEIPPTPDDVLDENITTDSTIEKTPLEKKEYTYYIKSNADSLNIRSGIGTSFSSLGYLDKDDMLLYKGQQNGWYITIYKERTAYVNSTYSVVVRLEKTTNIIENVLTEGYSLLGYPYVFGAQRYHWGNGVINSSYVPGLYDCSSFTQYIFYKGARTLLDVNTRTQILQGKTVSTLQRGDLMFFTNSSRYNNTGIERVGHVAIYLGGNYIMHTASDYAVIEPISKTRWSYYIIAKRFL